MKRKTLSLHLARAVKHDAEKTRLDLFPPEAFEEIGKVPTFGAKKYEAENWRKGLSYRRMLAGVYRHLNAWAGGQDLDPESGLSHLAHAGCGLSFLIASEKSQLGEDDRWKPSKK